MTIMLNGSDLTVTPPTTGVAERKSLLLDPAQRQRFSHRLALNHRIAQGDAAPAHGPRPLSREP